MFFMVLDLRLMKIGSLGRFPFFVPVSNTASIRHPTLPLRACLNFALPQFENYFRGCFSAFTRRIAGYLTSKNGETDRKQTQKGADKNTIGKFKQALSHQNVYPDLSVAYKNSTRQTDNFYG